MKHLDLFSGIGGFALAASWVWGDEHDMHSFVEIDPFCQKVLNKHWPDVPIISDIRDCTYEKTVCNSKQQHECGIDKKSGKGENAPCKGRKNKKGSFRKHSIAASNGFETTGRTKINLLTGGFPCQPFSVAGKQRSQEDDRYLWPEMLRVIQEFRPTWIIGENVAGIINLALDQVLSDLESASYEVQSFLIPACGVDAPHRRDRVWIVAHDEGIRLRSKTENGGMGRGLRPAECGKRDRESKPSMWIPESDVDRVAPGLPTTLDETIRDYGYEIYGDNPEIFTEIDSVRRKILREMRNEGQEIKPSSYRQEGNSNSNSMYKLSCLRAHERWKLGQRIEENKELRDMWKRICSKPFKETQDLQQAMLKRIRQIERNEAVASSRVDRLRALGNAIVPQTVVPIMQAIKNLGV